MINLVKLQCPNCGANLEVKEDAKFCFCMYCGTKILLNNENERTVRIIDEARIKEAELNHDLELRRMERESVNVTSNLEEKKLKRDIALAQAYGENAVKERKKERSKQTRIKQIVVFAACLVGGIVIGVGSGYPFWIIIGLVTGLIIALGTIPKRENEKVMAELGYAKFPKITGSLNDQDPSLLAVLITQAGFTNVTSENLHDLKRSLFHKESGHVEKITINGKIPSGGIMYPSNAPIVITYHGY